MNEQIYKKKGRKYIPLGYSDGFTGFPSEGIWVVYNRPSAHSSTCIAQVGEFKNLDYELLANLVRTKEDACHKALRKVLERERYSQSDMVRCILEEICKKE